MKFRFRLCEFTAINQNQRAEFMEDGVYFSSMDGVLGEEFSLLLMLKPSSLHPPHTESIAKPFMCYEAAARCRVWVLFVITKNLTQEVDISRGQAQCLYFTKFIWWQGRYDLPKLIESLVQCLCSLSFAHVRHSPLVAFAVSMLVRVGAIFAFWFRTTRCSVLSPGMTHVKRLLVMW